MLLPFSPHFRAQELNYRAQKAQKCERTFCSALCCSCLLRGIIPRLHFLVSNFHFQMKQDVICGALFFLFAKLVADKRPQQEKKAQRELQQTSSLILVMHARRAISPRNNIAWPCSHCRREFSPVCCWICHLNQTFSFILFSVKESNDIWHRSCHVR